MRKPMFKQTTKSGCGSIALANLFNAKFFVNELPDVGEYTYDLNKKLDVYDNRFFIDTICLTQSFMANSRIEDLRVFEDPTLKFEQGDISEFCRPFLVIINNGFRHHYLLVVQDCQSKRLYVVDGLSDTIEVLSPLDFMYKYWVIGIEGFIIKGVEHNKNSWFAYKSEFQYIFE